MKKIIFGLATLICLSLTVFGQPTDKRRMDAKTAEKAQAIISPMPATTSPKVAIPQQDTKAASTTTNNQNADLSVKFNTEEHSFGNVPEGPSVSYDFEFKNIGKVPIILSNVQASCGCTTPTWPKEPILPGKSSKIAVTYSTQGRPGPISKTVTVTTNVGTKILKIAGNVEKAPTPATPATPASDSHEGHNH